MKTAISFIIGIGNQIWKAFILTMLWGWFIAPKFGLPKLGIVDAAGVSMVVNLVLAELAVGQAWATAEREMAKTMDSGTTLLVKAVATGTIVYPVCLLGAYVWHLFQ